VRRRRQLESRPVLLAALLLAVASAVLVWPGVAAYDAVTQFTQAITGRYDDWHPPIMARLWSLFLKAGAWGTAPMLLLQLALFWSGLGMLAVALRRAGAPVAGWCALAVGLLPPVIDWMVVVDKDCQMIAAMVCAVGVLALIRIGRQAAPIWAGAIVAMLLIYAWLLRANAVFAVMPLAFVWVGWFGIRRRWVRAALLLAATLAAIGVSGPINHRLLGADRSGVQYTLPIFDLAGISHRTHLAAMPGLSPADWSRAERLHCATPFYWDPFADPVRCGPMGNALVSDEEGPPPLFRNWITEIVAHPLAYAGHRAAHLNATLRIATPPDEHSAAAPFATPENLYDIGSKATPLTRALGRIAGLAEQTPIGAPAVWLVALLAIGGVLLGTPRQPPRDLALSLILSATLMTASFAIVSIASDLRYHLWLITATGLSVVLLGACREVPRGRLAIAALVVAAACAGSILLRAGAAPMPY
jgi:hypothetical protein